jgi:tetratricopeptide (TPR) repeat protein
MQIIHNGLKFHSHGDLLNAKIEYEKVILSPKDLIDNATLFEAYRLISKIDTQLNSPEKAIVSLENALKLQPNHVEINFDLGNSYQHIKNFTSAIRCYEQVHKINPQHIEAFINKGVALKEMGQINESIESFNTALNIDPKNDNAWCNLGLSYHILGRFELSLECYEKALAINTNSIETYVNRADTLNHLKRFSEALHDCENAISINPRTFQAYTNLGNTHKLMGNLNEAEKSYKKALSLNPIDPVSLNNLGFVLRELRQEDEAIKYFKLCIDLHSNNEKLYLNLIECLESKKQYEEALKYSNLLIGLNSELASGYFHRGNALFRLKQFVDAEKDFHKSTFINPLYAEAFNNLGMTLKELNQPNDAIENYNKALQIRPNYPHALNNKGVALLELNLLNEAYACLDEATQIDQNYAAAYCNKGLVLKGLHQFDESYENHLKAVQLDAESGVFHWNLGLLLLLKGNLNQGFKEYEWRWKNPQSSLAAGKREFIEPLWLGDQHLKNKTILIYCEQGLGDTIQFSRYVPLFNQLECTVILEVQASLVSLFKNMPGISAIFAKGQKLPKFDYQCPIMSLPYAFDTTIDTIPPIQPIFLEEAKITEWEKILGPKYKPRIGLAWSGSITHGNDRNRSIDLEQYISYLIPEFEYISLQKEVREVDNEVLRKSDIRDFSEKIHDFSDTAALVSLIDLVITVDTSVAHLAASLDKPTLILISHTPDWRWMMNRDNSPWYPTVKLYRQQNIGDWQSALQTLFDDLLSIKSILVNN